MELKCQKSDKNFKLYNPTSEADTAFGKQIMLNKEFRRLLTECSIKDSGRNDVAYGGSCVIGNLFKASPKYKVDLSALQDPYTVDLVSIELDTRCARGKDKQCTYSSIEEYAAKNLPAPGKITIYYISDATGNGKSLDVHWNTVIVDPKAEYVMVYDPSGDGYNFNSDKRMLFCKSIAKNYNYPIVTIQFDECQQQVCNSKCAGVDIFCQSWVVFFAAIYITDQLKGLAKIDFGKYQALPLKMWISCMVKRYQNILSFEDYGLDLTHFFRYAILQGERTKEYTIANMPSIIPCGDKMPVTYSVVKNFEDPKSKNTFSIDRLSLSDRPSLLS